MLNKAWSTADRASPSVSTAVTTGEETEADADAEPAKMKPSDQPLLIYVHDGSDNEDFTKIEDVVLQCFKVAAARNAFRCVKMTPEAVENDPALAGNGKAPSRLLVVDRDWKKVQVIEGKNLSSKKLYTAMKKSANRAYKTKLDKNVKGLLKLLNEFNKINNARKVLDEKEKRLGSEITKAEAKKIAKEREELAEAQKEADELRDKYYTFELKPIKA